MTMFAEAERLNGLDKDIELRSLNRHLGSPLNRDFYRKIIRVSFYRAKYDRFVSNFLTRIFPAY